MTWTLIRGGKSFVTLLKSNSRRYPLCLKMVDRNQDEICFGCRERNFTGAFEKQRLGELHMWHWAK
jgi:hypothetical protein